MRCTECGEGKGLVIPAKQRNLPWRASGWGRPARAKPIPIYGRSLGSLCDSLRLTILSYTCSPTAVIVRACCRSLARGQKALPCARFGVVHVSPKTSRGARYPPRLPPRLLLARKPLLLFHGSLTHPNLSLLHCHHTLVARVSHKLLPNLYPLFPPNSRLTILSSAYMLT